MNIVKNNFNTGEWNKIDIDFLKKNYGVLTSREIGRNVNRSHNAVQIKARRLGLGCKSKYTYNQNYFNIIDTEDKAYWAGFIMADGSVIYNTDTRAYGLSIKLQGGDAHHLRKFNKCIDGNVHVKEFTRKGNFPDKSYNDKYYDGCSIRLYSQKIAQDLIDIGILPNKTYKDIKMPNISDNLMWHFVRGFLDGDGHVCVPQGENKYGYRIGFTCGSKSFLLEMQGFFERYGIYMHLDKSRNIYKLETRNSSHIKTFISHCFDGCSIYLDRKYKNYKKLKELLS